MPPSHSPQIARIGACRQLQSTWAIHQSTFVSIHRSIASLHFPSHSIHSIHLSIQEVLAPPQSPLFASWTVLKEPVQSINPHGLSTTFTQPSSSLITQRVTPHLSALDPFRRTQLEKNTPFKQRTEPFYNPYHHPTDTFEERSLQDA